MHGQQIVFRPIKDKKARLQACSEVGLLVPNASTEIALELNYPKGTEQTGFIMGKMALLVFLNLHYEWPDGSDSEEVELVFVKEQQEKEHPYYRLTNQLRATL